MRVACVLCLFLGLTFTLGCGDSGPPVHFVKGKVVNNGQPMAFKPLIGRVVVDFKNLDPKELDVKQAEVEPDGSFIVRGAGKGIAAGKYKVIVEWYDDYPTGGDKLKGKFSEANTPLTIEVPLKEDLSIDVGKAKKK